MKKSVKRLLFWAPRALCILFAVFGGLFALRAFGEGYAFWLTMLVLLMHLIPVGIILVVLAVSWRWELVGAIVFSFFGVLGIIGIVGSPGQAEWYVYLIICAWFLMGFLFLINRLYRKELRAGD